MHIYLPKSLRFESTDFASVIISVPSVVIDNLPGQEAIFLGHRGDSRLAPTQWETSLQSNAVSLAGRKPTGRISPMDSVWQNHCILKTGSLSKVEDNVTFLKGIFKNKS